MGRHALRVELEIHRLVATAGEENQTHALELRELVQQLLPDHSSTASSSVSLCSVNVMNGTSSTYTGRI